MIQRGAGRAGLLGFLMLLALGCGARAQTAPDPKKAEVQAAWADADKAGTAGPAEITLRDQAKLSLPKDYFFVPQTEGLRVMRAYGNTPNPATFTGLVVGSKPEDNWLVVINFIKEGYIRDDDAKDWNAEDLLSNLREGTEQSNKEREARGFPHLEIVGWVEKPAWDAAAHRLVWSLSTRQKGAAAGATPGVNYNTYALGREGYFSLNLLTDLSRVEAQKAIPRYLLASLAYEPGKRYEDFNASTDRVAEYGLAALIGVAAAKKLGFLALIGVFFAQFAKIILVAIAAGGALLVKLLRSRKAKAGPGPGDGTA